MRMLMLPRYDALGASSRLRMLQYVPALEAGGVDVHVSALLDDGYVTDMYAGSVSVWKVARGYLRRFRVVWSARDYDVVWLEKELFPWLPSWLETWLLPRQVTVVADYDDAVFHRYDRHRFGLVRWLLRNKIDRVMRRADVVTVGNEYLAERATQAGASLVEWLPTVVDLDRYSAPQTKKPGSVTIGWIGSPATAHYLHWLNAVLEKVGSSEPGLRCVAIGARADQLAGTQFEAWTWSEAGEVGMLQQFDIGIMPLPDEPWERGKCGYKLIQYMACGLPVVASAVGVNVDIVQDGENGYLGRDPEEWVHALTRLVGDPSQRELMGSAGRQRVETTYSLQAQAVRLVGILQAAAERKARPRKLKIVHVIASMGMGGAESLLADIVERQVKDGHDVSILTFKNVNKVPLSEGVQVYSANYESGTPLGGIKAVLRLAALLRELRGDVVHSHMLHANILTRMLRPFVGFPTLINTVHAAFETGNFFYRICYRALDQLANVTAFVSRAAQQRYSSEGLTPAHRSTVVYNGINIDRFRADIGARVATRQQFGMTDDTVVLLAIGRLTEHKDYPNLFLAFDRVAKAEPNTILLIVGEGELAQTLKDSAGTSVWSDRIIFTGLRHDIPSLLSASDVLVLASSYEGFGLVLAEAMACRVPVVTTNCGGTAEVVGDAGLVVPKKDPAALAAAIFETLRLPPEKLECQLLRARKRVEEMFSIEATMASWYRLYEEHSRDLTRNRARH